MASRPAVIVLAAGEGSRFAGAGHKLAQLLGGSTVLGTTLRHAIASELRVVVVTTAALADMARLQVAARDVVVLPDVATAGRDVLGMGRSIAAGVSARPNAACRSLITSGGRLRTKSLPVRPSMSLLLFEW